MLCSYYCYSDRCRTYSLAYDICLCVLPGYSRSLAQRRAINLVAHSRRMPVFIESQYTEPILRLDQHRTLPLDPAHFGPLTSEHVLITTPLLTRPPDPLQPFLLFVRKLTFKVSLQFRYVVVRLVALEAGEWGGKE